MDIENLQQTIRELTEKNAILEAELKETREHLKKYTAPTRHKKFYENHKDEILTRNKEYFEEKVTKEKRKEYARTAYLNQKEKKKQQSPVEDIKS